MAECRLKLREVKTKAAEDCRTAIPMLDNEFHGTQAAWTLLLPPHPPTHPTPPNPHPMVTSSETLFASANPYGWPNVLQSPVRQMTSSLQCYLVGGLNPSEKYERQLGWLFPIYGKIKLMATKPPTSYVSRAALVASFESWKNIGCQLAWWSQARKENQK